MNPTYRKHGVDADLVYSPDELGWYANDFGDHGPRVSDRIYDSMAELVQALDSGEPQWEDS